VKKDLALIGGLFLVIIVLLIFGKGFTSAGLVNKSLPKTNASKSASIKDTINIRNSTFSVEIADSQSEREKGLSDRESLPIDHAMLFVFEKSDIYSIWMKDMRFAIDIIWIDKNKKIVDISDKVAPEPNKNDRDLTIYTPKGDSKYVLEINAGLASLNNIQIGDSVEF